jgi:hypothetical protein
VNALKETGGTPSYNLPLGIQSATVHTNNTTRTLIAI